MRLGRLAPMQVAATIGLIIVAIMVAILVQQRHPAPASALSSRPTATPLPAVPSKDLEAANLSAAAALVTPLSMVANDGSAKTLIGAYADTTRTVLFFRSPSPEPGSNASPTISVYDSHGFLNGGTTGGRGIAGDTFFGLDLGPRLDQDGLAHLTVTSTVPQASLTGPPPSTGWAFRFTLKVQASTALSAPATFPLGSWKVMLESLAATPSVIDFQAVVAGANNEQLFSNIQTPPITLLDAAGKQVNPITATGGVTVPKQQLNATTYQNTRVHYQWARPASGASYRLRIVGNGATKVIPLEIPPL